IEHCLVLRRDADQVISLASPALCYAADRQVIALRRTAGEHNLSFARANRRCDARPCGIDRLLSFPAKAMAYAPRITEPFRKVRQHRLDHSRIDPRGGVVVHVDGKLHGEMAKWK